MARLDARWGNFSERNQAWDHFWQDAPAGGSATTYTIVGDVALSFGVAAALVFTPVGEPVLTSGGRAVQWTPRPEIHVRPARVGAPRFGCAANYAASRVMGGAAAFSRWAVSSRRTFVLQPDPLGPVSEEQLVVAAAA